jgi:hypothetical protein
MTLLLLGCDPVTGPAKTELAKILNAHTEAMGGSSAIEYTNGVEIELRIVEPAFTVTAKYLATRDGRMRIDVFHDGEAVFTEAYNGKAGWQWLGDDAGAIDMSPEGEAALQRGIVGNIFGLHELPLLNYNLSLIGQQMVDGTNYWLIDTESPDGFSRRLYINAATYLTQRSREKSALHPDIDPETRRFESLHSDYRKQAGRLFSFKGKKVDLDTGEVVQTTEILRLATNPEIDNSFFDKPLNIGD